MINLPEIAPSLLLLTAIGVGVVVVVFAFPPSKVTD
jgi:hypothetical protein